MKTTFETEDIEKIASEVLRKLKPLFKNTGNDGGKDIIFDVRGLSEYLKVDESCVYKQVQLKTIPYFKCGKYTRFKKFQVDKWIDEEKTRVQWFSYNLF